MENKGVKNYDLYNSKTSDVDYIEKVYSYLWDTKNNISDKAKQKEINSLLDKINEHRQKALELNKNIKTDKISLSDKINIETTELPRLRSNVNNILKEYKTSINNENKIIDNPNISDELKSQVSIRKKDNEIINKKIDNYIDIKEQVIDVATPVDEMQTNTQTEPVTTTDDTSTQPTPASTTSQPEVTTATPTTETQEVKFETKKLPGNMKPYEVAKQAGLNWNLHRDALYKIAEKKYGELPGKPKSAERNIAIANMLANKKIVADDIQSIDLS